MVALKIFVEGGGDAEALKTACRKGFSRFLEKAGFRGHMPRIVASGARQKAFEDFCQAVRENQAAMLLIDAEEAVGKASAWDHLAQRQGDQWPKPPGSADDRCHLMVECMESWLIADRQTLAAYFGKDFRDSALPPPGRDIESVPKADLFKALASATQNCKAQYGKGQNSFDILSQIDPAKVTAASKRAAAFVASVKQAMGV